MEIAILAIIALLIVIAILVRRIDKKTVAPKSENFLSGWKNKPPKY